MAGPVHFTNNDLADSATDPMGPRMARPIAVGKEFVTEANRLGIILDASHAPTMFFDQMLALSAAPIILSHSGARAVFGHPRNIDDASIPETRRCRGGRDTRSTLSRRLSGRRHLPKPTPREAALRALGVKYGPFRTLSGERLKSYMGERHTVEARYPIPKATIDDLMAHLFHALKLVGPEHVGIGLDWDGGGGVTGMEDVAGLPEISKRLLAAGYTEADLANIWSGNALRVMRSVEAKAAELAHK